jgi:2-amino-4-hydroxy-6-hydroxymethyldihydropteridine diphosphokinase
LSLSSEAAGAITLRSDLRRFLLRNFFRDLCNEDGAVMNTHLVALGANAGGSVAANARAVARAARRLSDRFGGRMRLSPLYATPAWPPGSGPDFVNAAAAIVSPLGPEAMLDRLHAVEALHGRVRTLRWGARRLDLDLLATGGLVRPDRGVQAWWRLLDPATQRAEAPDRLILPHPRLADRAFVLIPLAAVAPGWRHPITGRRVADMAASLPTEARRGVRRLRGTGSDALVKTRSIG